MMFLDESTCFKSILVGRERGKGDVFDGKSKRNSNDAHAVYRRARYSDCVFANRIGGRMAILPRTVSGRT